ncbi:putative serine protease PepD [Kineosphaera limosa]|uniref:Putative peptidase S1 family protein n=1 Tax=Kineosphaera limosa NBRC 100340 TaxID=1184609 RepID=K6WU17_9MICO|nr:trypsin-like peptidase domain-containing protein [Kineosphaera limosa]NYD99652.1 putative serine protease PepD [Kineosphaera limosa]GAB95607.1 putative peptidase S1 family protein [Kineosphaera limosa NBRC 100340]
MSENRPESGSDDWAGRGERPEPTTEPTPPTGPLWHGGSDASAHHGVRSGYAGFGTPDDPSQWSRQGAPADSVGGSQPAAGGAGTQASVGAYPGGSGSHGPTGYGPGGGPARRRRRPATSTMLVASLAALLVLGGAVGAYLLSPANSQQVAQQAGSASGEQRWPASEPPVRVAEGSAPDWVATAAAVAPSVVAITVADSSGQGGEQGSGVILDAQGHVVTNHHVVASGIGGGADILVTLTDKRAYKASIVGTDPSTDLAVLSITDAPKDLTPISMGDATQLKVGSPVMAVGNPLGLAGTVTTGIVSALNRPVTTQQAAGNSPLGGGGEFVVTNAIQTSAAINPGNSGGALVNASGQLVGINSSIAQTSQDGGNIGIGFAIPVNEARSVSDQILTNGSVRHPYLGVTGRGGYVRDGDAQRAAAIIDQITPGSPAQQAGLRNGDAVVAIDDEPIDSWEGLVAQVRERDVNAGVKLTIVRDGSRQDVQATLAQRPASMN